MIRIKPDANRASSLLEMAKRRLEDLSSYPKYKQVEEYWDAAKEAILAIMYYIGFHTTSHRELIEWIRKKGLMESHEVTVLDMLRKARNGISYYGEKEMEKILDNYDIERIVRKLVKIAESTIPRQ